MPNDNITEQFRQEMLNACKNLTGKPLEVNQEQMDKFTDLVSFMFRLSKENRDITLHPVDLSPSIVMSVVVEFESLSFILDEPKMFCKVAQYASLINMEVNDAGNIELCVNIPDVYVKVTG